MKEKKIVPIAGVPSDTNLKLWYCKVCGYVAFREEPPYECPICKAKKDMFGQIVFGVRIGIQ